MGECGGGTALVTAKIIGPWVGHVAHELLSGAGFQLRSFAGTPGVDSPEPFAGIQVDSSFRISFARGVTALGDGDGQPRSKVRPRK